MVETQPLATVPLYGAWLQSTFCSGMLNWSEIGTGWMTVRILFRLYEASAKASRCRA